jgi:hypothetical protein
MNYADAKAIIAETHPELLIDDSPGTMRHILVRKQAKGPHFNVMLPESTDAMPATPEEQREALVLSLNEAAKRLPD